MNKRLEMHEDFKYHENVASFNNKNLFIISKPINPTLNKKLQNKSYSFKKNMQDYTHQEFTIQIDNNNPVHIRRNEKHTFQNFDTADIPFIHDNITFLNIRATSIANTYILHRDNQWILIDSGCNDSRTKTIKQFMSQHNIQKFDKVYLTHLHPDHWANLGNIIDTKTPIYISPSAKPYVNYPLLTYHFTFTTLLKTMDSYHYLNFAKFSKTFISIIQFFSQHFPKIGARVFTQIFMSRFIGHFPPIDKNQFHFFNNNSEIKFGDIFFNGWDIGSNIFVIPMPGHTQDSVAYYLKDNNTIIVGDINSFLNLNDMTSSNVDDLLHSLKLLIRLVQNERIELFCSGHSLPITGQENIINHLQTRLQYHENIIKSLSDIINQKETWESYALSELIYKSDDPYIQFALNFNFPKSAHIIEYYAYFLLKRMRYACIDETKKIWKKIN